MYTGINSDLSGLCPPHREYREENFNKWINTPRIGVFLFRCSRTQSNGNPSFVECLWNSTHWIQANSICNVDMVSGSCRSFTFYMMKVRAWCARQWVNWNYRRMPVHRTIGSLVSSEDIQFSHLAEALQASQSSQAYDEMRTYPLSLHVL